MLEGRNSGLSAMDIALDKVATLVFLTVVQTLLTQIFFYLIFFLKFGVSLSPGEKKCTSIIYLKCSSFTH